MNADMFEQCALAMGAGKEFNSQVIQYLPTIDFSTGLVFNYDQDIYFKDSLTQASEKVQWWKVNSDGSVTTGQSAANTPSNVANASWIVRIIPGTNKLLLVASGAGLVGDLELCTYDFITDTFSANTTISGAAPGLVVKNIIVKCASATAIAILVHYPNQPSGSPLAKLYTSNDVLTGWALKATINADATYVWALSPQLYFANGRYAFLIRKANSGQTVFAWAGYVCSTINGTYTAVTWKNTTSFPCVTWDTGVDTTGDLAFVVWDSADGFYYTTTDFGTYQSLNLVGNGQAYMVGGNLLVTTALTNANLSVYQMTSLTANISKGAVNPADIRTKVFSDGPGKWHYASGTNPARRTVRQ